MEIEVNEIFMEYISEKIIFDMRSKIIIEPLIVDNFINKQFMKYLRNSIDECDLGILNKYMNSSHLIHKKFAFTLLQKFKNKSEIKKIVFEFWEKATSYEEKWLVMFNLLDYKELDEKIHIEIFEFVKTNLKRWLYDTCKYMSKGDESKILNNVNDRINDKKYPKSKDWIYLLIAFSSPDREKLLKLLKDNQDENFLMNKKILEYYYSLNE